MFWDIVLPVLAGLAQVITGFVGWRVTVDGVKSGRKTLYECLFAIASLAGVGAVGIAAYRGTTTGVELEALRLTIAHSHIHVSVDALAMDDPSKFSGRIFNGGMRTQFNVGYQNVGPSSPAENVRVSGRVLIESTRPDLDAIFRELKTDFRRNPKGDELLPQERQFFTVHSASLGEDDPELIEKGEKGLFVVAVVRFSDPTGDYDQEICQSLQPPAKYPVWHPCGTHDQEIKLK